jgi:hypothetical protein
MSFLKKTHTFFEENIQFFLENSFLNKQLQSNKEKPVFLQKLCVFTKLACFSKKMYLFLKNCLLFLSCGQGLTE